jgi:hypothetical protein
VVYAAFGTSRQLIVNPDAAVCAMVAAIVAPLAGGNAGLYVSLAVALAVFAGVACIAAGLFTWGFSPTSSASRCSSGSSTASRRCLRQLGLHLSASRVAW